MSTIRPFLFLIMLSSWHSTTLATTLSGIVTEEGKGVSGAEVLLVDEKTSILLASKFSDKSGAFLFPVIPGLFDIGVFKSDYATVWTRGVEIKEIDAAIQVELVPSAFVEGAQEDSDDCD